MIACIFQINLVTKVTVIAKYKNFVYFKGVQIAVFILSFCLTFWCHDVDSYIVIFAFTSILLVVNLWVTSQNGVAESILMGLKSFIESC
jgi:hypothetical protein